MGFVRADPGRLAELVKAGELRRLKQRAVAAWLAVALGGASSRHAVEHLTGLSKATVNRAIGDLRRRGLIIGAR